MAVTKKMVLVFGDVALTLTPDDVEAVYREWVAANPGKSLRQMLPEEFSKKLMDRMISRAKRGAAPQDFDTHFGCLTRHAHNHAKRRHHVVLRSRFVRRRANDCEIPRK